MRTGKHSTINNIVPFANGNKSNVSSLPNVVISSSESKRRIEELQAFVDEVMVKGVDYGMVGFVMYLGFRRQ
ncbi:hypothetical protein WAK64_14995 [Bacillus spongiae]|uniref:Uncharacterized protein n=1 Tax=Bacillus spongiae TaxID=2683610 RepID=A0ABU8HG65_9BACI